ncbi:PREDICTED: osteomodulin-like, partial [Branchiostoma belcheri]|uniref:Osteomodulin-like n=1 Tax=Branchiostoma belcheri TaxID=7741 RepID=A0A6P4YTP3_BRABE
KTMGRMLKQLLIFPLIILNHAIGWMFSAPDCSSTRCKSATSRGWMFSKPLTILNLFHNKIGKIPPGVFSNLPNLTMLHLEYNQITERSDGNNIVQIHPGAFSKLPKRLESLQLSQNQITTIPANAISNLPNLAHLYLFSVLSVLRILFTMDSKFNQGCMMFGYCYNFRLFKR